jgi:hypothetical protein
MTQRQGLLDRRRRHVSGWLETDAQMQRITDDIALGRAVDFEPGDLVRGCVVRGWPDVEANTPSPSAQAFQCLGSQSPSACTQHTACGSVVKAMDVSTSGATV